MADASQLTTLAARLDHPEGVAWGPDGFLYAGGEDGQIYRIDLASGTAEQYAGTGGCVLGLALDADANVYACDMLRREVVRVEPDGACSTYCAGTPERPMRHPNYPVFDAAGSLYVSDSGAFDACDGVIWRIAPSGEADVWCERANGFTNGMCLSADGRALYVVESSPPLVSRVAIGADGAAGDHTVLVELPGTVPDGVALDVQGRLYISLFHPNALYRLDGDDLALVFDDPRQLVLNAPTNVAFAGADLRTLAIACLGWWHPSTARVAVPGLPLRYPTLPRRRPAA